MDFDDQRVDASQLEDRRGMGGGAMAGIGAGGLGIVGLLVALLLGVNPFSSGGGAAPGLGAGGGAAPSSDVAVRCNAAGAIERDDDCYVLKVFNEVNEVWTSYYAAQGQRYTRPTLVFFDGATRTGCGAATARTGPFYCPADERVYIDLGFLRQMQAQFGIRGRYAQAYIVAHEVGHHVQTLLGTEGKVRRASQQNPSRANALSVRLELQADCYAGVYGRRANDAGNQRITQAELRQAIDAAAAVGDDRIAEAAGSRLSPESFTHGSAAQRQDWYQRGFDAGTVGACNTFG